MVTSFKMYRANKVYVTLSARVLYESRENPQKLFSMRGGRGRERVIGKVEKVTLVFSGFPSISTEVKEFIKFALKRENINFPPRPGGETFTPANPEIGVLEDYVSAPKTWWKCWPVVPLPEAPTTRIRFDLLEHMATVLPPQSKHLADMVISHLKEGANILCKGVGRKVTTSLPAPSAYKAGEAFTDAVVSWLKGGFVSGHTSTLLSRNSNYQGPWP